MTEREAERLSSAITGGHAFEKHQSEFGFATREQFRELIERILRNPSESRPLRRKRIAYWDEASSAIVIVDENVQDQGTMFRPLRGKLTFDRLK